MSNVINLHRDTVAEVLESIEKYEPEMVIAFVKKGDEFRIERSNVQNVTTIIGALERMKLDLILEQS